MLLNNLGSFLFQNNVYLAGPIDGVWEKDATDWRYQTTDALKAYFITCFSPLRYKEFLKDQMLGGAGDHPLTTQEGIVTRDLFDVMRASVLLVNFLGAKKVSIGTVFEIAWAYLLRKPIVLVMEQTGNVHDHLFIREACGFRVETLGEGIDLVCKILLP